MRQIVFPILLILLYASCTSKFGRILKSKDSEYKYKMAEQYFVNKKYNNAQQLFEDLFPIMKGKENYEDLFYKLGYCYFYEKDYLNAENIFKTFTETFPSSKRSEECEYMRAYCYYKQSPKVDLDQTTTNKAMSLMQAFINMHPNSEKQKEATEIIDLCREKLELKEYKSADLYYNLGHFKAASVAFNNILEDFPDSKLSDEYKFLEIKSYYKYAELSIEEKQEERFKKVLSECTEFVERFSDSKYINDVNKFITLTNNYLKKLKK